MGDLQLYNTQWAVRTLKARTAPEWRFSEAKPCQSNVIRVQQKRITPDWVYQYSQLDLQNYVSCECEPLDICYISIAAIRSLWKRLQVSTDIEERSITRGMRRTRESSLHHFSSR